MVFTARLSAASGLPVTVYYATANNSATAPADYTAVRDSVTITAGQLVNTITVPIVGDGLDEPNETFFVNLTSATNATIAVSQGLGTIIDDDLRPTVSISDAIMTEGGPLEFVVSLTTLSGYPSVSVDYTTSNLTAVAGSDYVAQTSQTLIFLPGGSLSQTVTIVTTDDLSDELDETLTVTLSNLVNLQSGVLVGLGTILDNDGPPTLSVNNVSENEGTSLSFTVSLSATSSMSITVDYATSNGTALSGVDYSSASNNLTFAPGDLTKTITVLTTDDAIDEADKTVNLTLSSPTNATLATAIGIGTILDDDTPNLSINNVSSVTEGVDLVFTLVLSPASSRDVSVDYNIGGGTATSGSDYTAATFGTLTFLAGQTQRTITVPTQDDSLNEALETLILTLSNAPYLNLVTTSATGTITDNDPQPNLTVLDAIVTEGRGNLEFTVKLSTASGQIVTVDYATAAGTATSGADFISIINGSLTFAPGELTKTVTVITNDDLLDEFIEDLTLDFSNESNANLTDATGLGSITDDDPLPSLTISNATKFEGNDLVFTVTLSAPSGKPVTVNYATADGPADNTGAVAGQDFVSLSNTLTFAPGQVTKQITINATDDAVQESTETFTVGLSAATNATISVSTGTGTIIDDDPEIVVEYQTPGGTFVELTDNATIDFGAFLIDPTNSLGITKTIRITNQGDLDLNISSITLPNNSGFTISSPLSQTLIPAGGFATFDITFDITAEGTFNTTLTINSNDLDEAAFDLNLTGIVFVTQPEIEVEYFGGGEFQSGGIVDFGATFKNEPLTKVFTIRNTGDAALNLSVPANPTGYSTSLPGPSVVIPVNRGTLTFTITLLASATGFFDQNLIFSSNDLDEGQFALRLIGRVRDAALVAIIDNDDPGFSRSSGNWSINNLASGVGYADDYRYSPDSDTSAPAGTAIWDFTPTQAGLYRISTTWLHLGLRPTTSSFDDGPATYDIFAGTGTNAPLLASATLNQKGEPNDFYAVGTDWEDIGFVTSDGSIPLRVVLYAPPGNERTRVTADAVRFERMEPSDDILYLPGGRDSYHIDVRTNDVPNGNLDVRLGDTNLTGLPAAELPKVWKVTDISGPGLTEQVTDRVWKKDTSDTTIVINPDGSQTVNFADPFAPDLDGFSYILGVDPNVVFQFSDIAPIVEDDSFSTSHGHSLTFDVLANDSDPQGDRLYAEIVGVADGHFETIQPGVRSIISDTRIAIELKNQPTWTLTFDLGMGAGPQTISMAPGDDHVPLKTAIESAGLPSGVTVETRTAKRNGSAEMLLGVRFVFDGVTQLTTPISPSVSVSSGTGTAQVFERGRLTTNADGTSTYLPNKTFFRAHPEYVEKIRYSVRDSQTGGNPGLKPGIASVSVTNSAPYLTGLDRLRLTYSAATDAQNIFQIPLNVFDADGDELEFRATASAGNTPGNFVTENSVTLVKSGRVLFETTGAQGLKFYDYFVTDGHSFSPVFTTQISSNVNPYIEGLPSPPHLDDGSTGSAGWTLDAYHVRSRTDGTARENIGSASVDLNAGSFLVSQGLDVDLRQTTATDGVFSLLYESNNAMRQPVIQGRVLREFTNTELVASGSKISLKWKKVVDGVAGSLSDNSYSLRDVDGQFNVSDQPLTVVTEGLDDYLFSVQTPLRMTGQSINGQSLVDVEGNGVYRWEIEATLTVTDGTNQTTKTIAMQGDALLTGDQFAEGNPFQGFGQGWSLAGLPSLWVELNQIGTAKWRDNTAILMQPGLEDRLFVGQGFSNEPWRAVDLSSRTTLPKELGGLISSDQTNEFLYTTTDGTKYTFRPVTDVAAQASSTWTTKTHSFFAQLREIDPLVGPNTMFTYLADGRLDQIQSADGSQTTFNYTASNLSSIAMPGSRTMSVTVGAATTGSTVKTITDLGIGNYVRSFTYADDGASLDRRNIRLTSDISGNASGGAIPVETHFAYDATGLINSVTLGSGATSSTYGVRPAALYTPDSTTNQLPSVFGELDRTVGELILPTADLQKYSGGSGQSLGYGLRKYYFFDANGRRDQESLYATTTATPATLLDSDTTNADITPLSDDNWDWDHFDNVTYFTDIAGRETRYTYDYNVGGQTKPVFNNLVEKFHFYTQATYQYENTHGWLIHETDAKGDFAYYLRDPMTGLINVVTKPNFVFDVNNWDSNDLLESRSEMIASFTDSFPFVNFHFVNTTGLTYDTNRRLLTQTVTDTSITGEARVTTFDYTTNLFVDAVTVGGSSSSVRSTTKTTFDVVDRVTKNEVFDFNGTTLLLKNEMEYFSNGLVSKSKDGDGIETASAYDSRGFQTTVTAGAQGATPETTAMAYYQNGEVKTVTFPDSHIQTFYFDPQNRKQVSVTDRIFTSWSGTTTLTPNFTESVVETTRDLVGNVIKTDDDLANLITEWKYDYLDRPVKQTQSGIVLKDGGSTVQLVKTSNFDAVGNQVQAVNSDGISATADYNGQRRATFTAIVENGTFSSHSARQSFGYDSDGINDKSKEYRTPAGIAASETHDGFGRLKSRVDPDGLVTTVTYSFDTTENKTKVTTVDRNNVTTSQYFDGAGQLRLSVNAAGDRFEYDYTLAGRPDEERVIQNGTTAIRKTEHEYDDLGRENLVKAYDNIGATSFLTTSTVYGFGPTGRKITMTDPALNETVTDQDSVGNITRITQPDPVNGPSGSPHGKPVTTFQYDYAGVVSANTNGIFTIDPQGRKTRQVTNVVGWVLQEWDASVPAVKQVENEYDIAGRVRRTADALGNYSVMDYFAATGLVESVSVPVKSTDPVGAKTFYEYDASGNRTALIDPEGNLTEWEYDELSRVIAEKTQVLAFSTNKISTSIIKSRRWDHSVPLQTTYTDRNDRVTTFTTTPAARQTKEEWRNGANVVRTITATFDAAGAVIDTDDQTSVSGSGPNWNQVFDYDDLGRLTGDIFVAANGTLTRYYTETIQGYTTTGVRNSLTYDLDGLTRFTQSTLVDGLSRIYSLTQTNSASGNMLTVKQTFEIDGRLGNTKRTSSLASSDLIETTFGYFPNGDLQTILHTKGTSSPAPDIDIFTYTYDPAHRIKSFQVKQDADGINDFEYDAQNQLKSADFTNEAYDYDNNGNRTNNGENTQDHNLLVANSTHWFVYDFEGNRTKQIEKLPGNAEGETTAYQWDFRNRLSSLVITNASGSATKWVQFDYNANNLRIEKRVYSADPVSGATPTKVERYHYDGDDVVLVTDVTSSVQQTYMHGPAVDQIFADENALGQILWALTDHQGSVRDWVKPDGTLAQHTQYDSFGNILAPSDPTTVPTYSWTGREWDPDANMYYFRGRWYDQLTAKFVGDDPTGFGAGDTNLQRMMGNSPVNRTDPSGLEWWNLWGFTDVPDAESMILHRRYLKAYNAQRGTNFTSLDDTPEAKGKGTSDPRRLQQQLLKDRDRMLGHAETSLKVAAVADGAAATLVAAPVVGAGYAHAARGTYVYATTYFPATTAVVTSPWTLAGGGFGYGYAVSDGDLETAGGMSAGFFMLHPDALGRGSQDLTGGYLRGRAAWGRYFAIPQVTNTTLTTNADLRLLTNEAHELLGKGTRYKSTAVGLYTDDSTGIASSDTLVPRVQREWAQARGIRVVNGEGHADETLMNGGTRVTGALRLFEVSSPHGKTPATPNGAVCIDCEGKAKEIGAITTSPFSGRASRKRSGQ